MLILHAFAASGLFCNLIQSAWDLMMLILHALAASGLFLNLTQLA